MKLLLSLFVILVSSIPVAAQEFQSVRPTIVVSPGERVVARPDPGTVWCCHRPPRPSWVLPPAAPLVLPRVTLPPLLLFHTPQGLRGYVIEGAVALPIGGQTPSIFTPTWGLWDER